MSPLTIERDPLLDNTFTALGVPSPIVEALARQSITVPTPVQTATLPPAFAGRDVLGQGRTGSGKTIAFAIPVVVAVANANRNRRPLRPRALVLVPTRELATQVAATVAPLARAMSLRWTTVFGGVNQRSQVEALRAGVDILIACPGRLEDLVQQRVCSLEDVQITVLDEADHLADVGFLPAVRRLLDATPKGSQRLLYSATLDATVEALVRKYLNQPSVHKVDRDDDAPVTMEHHFFAVHAPDRFSVLREIAGGGERCLLFTRTKHAARKIARQLSQAGVPAVDLHGNLSQGARERNLAAFASGEVLVLVATDIAARGVHVDDIATVVHVDPPAEHKAYLHRSGRTARAGASGAVVTLIPPDQSRAVQKLAAAAGIKAVVHAVHPGHERLRGFTVVAADGAGRVRPLPAPRSTPPAQTAPPARPASPTDRERTGGAARAASGRPPRPARAGQPASAGRPPRSGRRGRSARG